ncbi:MAG: SAM-dependent methyltransferase [Kiloniellales bacterium]|nr:SAM-dependent methyltransferase [Kiloniellales bacterium]
MSQAANTPLGRRIARRIALHGPITVAEYMAQVLTDSAEGYYMTGDPFGRSGDFTTAPEISQMFGELFGLWCTEIWRRMGAPAPFRFVELGPGRGTMMADMLRAAQVAPGFVESAEIHLVEVSPALRKCQAERLAAFRPSWHNELAGVPDGPMILVANEFLDALPIRQLTRAETGWCERMVVADAEESLGFALAPPSAAAQHLVPPALREAEPGQMIEVSPAGHTLVGDIAGRVGRDGGAAILIDFGPAQSRTGESLQAVRRHAAHDVLTQPGTADLTAHVDFASLAQTARTAGAAVYGPIAQGRFLRRLGLDVRADALLKQATEAQARDIEAARRRLSDSEEMGDLFKVLAIAAPALGPLEDLETHG